MGCIMGIKWGCNRNIMGYNCFGILDDKWAFKRFKASTWGDVTAQIWVCPGSVQNTI
jgi:hypothetical protein